MQSKQEQIEALKKLVADALSGPLKKVRILIVEDDWNDAFLMAQKFSHYQVEIKMARTTEEAERMIIENGFQVIIADLKFPGMDGAELVKHIKDYNKETIFIIATGDTGSGLAKKAQEYGALILLPKPVTDEDIQFVFGLTRTLR